MKNLRTVGMALVLFLAFFVLGGCFIVTNELIALDEDINTAWAEIDNQLQRRSDLIPNYVSTVKGYAAHEEKIFTEVAEARTRLAGAQTVEEKASGYNAMQSALSRLLVVVEQYPDLKANANFIALQDELAGTENRLAVARKRYNDSVRTFNTKIRAFPGSMFAGNLGFSPRPYFEISETARQLPQVTF